MPGGPITIRSAGRDDADAIARIQVQTWRSAYRGIIPDEFLATLNVEERAAQWRDRLTIEPERRSVVLVAEEAGQIVGLVSGGRNRKPAFPFDAELYALYVAPHCQRRGVGRRLTRALVEILQRASSTTSS
jgi:ribosomal protein S18 acetylase RimI-like enzyme